MTPEVETRGVASVTCSAPLLAEPLLPLFLHSDGLQNLRS
jgi:hypothetical protein